MNTPAVERQYGLSVVNPAPRLRVGGVVRGGGARRGVALGAVTRGAVTRGAVTGGAGRAARVSVISCEGAPPSTRTVRDALR